MRIAIALLSLSGSIVAVGAQAAREMPSLKDVLERSGERVERFLTRAQSIVCLERVHLQPLGLTLSSEGMGRTVESELRLAWSPEKDGSASTSAQMSRQVLRVNGSKPRKNDRNGCTTPEQESREPNPLVLLLPDERLTYDFELKGMARESDRDVVLVDFQSRARPTVTSKMVEGRDDCVSFDVKDGTAGRLWIDAETFDVVRLDRRLKGLVDVPLPRVIARRPGASLSWTMERSDSSIRFKSVSFKNPDEVLMLPVSMSELSITRGAGTPRLRTMTEYINYQRFLTAGRVIGE